MRPDTFATTVRKRSPLWLTTPLAAGLITSSCGVWIEAKEDEPKEPEPAPVFTPSYDFATKDSTEFQGYVTSAFEVTVDGDVYRDMEDFYTAELARLPAKVERAGYDDSWQAEFDAQIGLSDLWHNMRIFIAPVEGQGYQSEAWASQAGSFRVRLPLNAVGHQYKVRANKRINVILTRGDETVKICYNFSAVESQIELADESLPIVLDTFETRVTAYECAPATGGLEVPGTGAKDQEGEGEDEEPGIPEN